jgi:hypothetical protein
MKHYTLTVDTLQQLPEIMETFGYIEEMFPSFISEHLDKYLGSREHSRDQHEKLNITKLKIGRFLEQYTNEEGEQYINVIRDGRNIHNNHDVAAKVIAKFPLSREHLEDANIIVEYALEQGLIEEVNYIELTIDERVLLLDMVKFRKSNLLHGIGDSEDDVLNNLIEKLK